MRRLTGSWWRVGPQSLLVAVLLSANLNAPTSPARQEVQRRVKLASTNAEFTISGRVGDPHGLRPADTILMLWRQDPDGGGSAGSPVPTAADGSFVTSLVPPGTYLLEVVRDSHSAARREMVVGLTIVTVTTNNIREVSVPVRRDTVLQGTFRMESDNPAAPWPSHIAVSAYLALPGASLGMGGAVSEGAPDGGFILRNAFGPRVLRPGWSGAHGGSWSPSRVLLDGKDITNVPTDFSKHSNAQLELIFTQHPAGVHGLVQTMDGGAASNAWILVGAADPNRREAWATTSHAVRADPKGRFRVTTLPGAYLARAYAPNRFGTRSLALRHLADLEPGAHAFQVGDREYVSIQLVLR